MKTINLALLLGGLSGFLAIGMGAYADHALRPDLAPQAFETLATALRYQLIHASLLAVIGLTDRTAMSRRASRMLGCATVFFTSGIVLFCGSLVIHSIWNIGWIIHLAPIGGTAFMAGWLCLAAMALTKTGGPT